MLTILQTLDVVSEYEGKSRKFSVFETYIIDLVIFFYLGCHSKIPYAGGLNNMNLLLVVLEAGSPSSWWRLIWLSGEGSFPSLQTAAFSICPLVCVWERSFPFLIRALLPAWGLHPMTSLKHNYLPKAPSPNTIAISHWGLVLQHINLREGCSLVHSDSGSIYQNRNADKGRNTISILGMMIFVCLFVWNPCGDS